MSVTEQHNFNEKMRGRTKRFAVKLFKSMYSCKLNDLAWIPVRQLLRSSSSVAANFRSAARGRSSAEFYLKICVVVEECDETLFWLEFLKDSGIISPEQIDNIRKEAEELLYVFSSIKKKLRQKRENSH